MSTPHLHCNCPACEQARQLADDAELDALRQEVARLRTALEVYADGAHWADHLLMADALRIDLGEASIWEGHQPGYAIARAALDDRKVASERANNPV